MNQQRQAEEERRQALADTLRRVTQAGQQGVVTGPGGGGTGEVATPDQRIMDALSSNPQTAPMAARLTIEQALQKPERLSASDLKLVQTPEGPRYARASEAEGKAPAREDQGLDTVTKNLPGGKAQDFIRRGGKLVPWGEPYARFAPSSMGGDGFEGLGASDTNAIFRQAGQLYGGIFDPQTGEFRALDAESAQKAQALAARASRLYAEGEGRLPHSEAVARAARDMGIDIRDIENERENRRAVDRAARDRLGAGAQPGPTKSRARRLGLENENRVIRFDAQGNRID